ncbi:MAG TPA: sulfotransferase [Pyrinomonadaceae bacterium]
MGEPFPPHGWTPIRIYFDGGRAFVDWCETRDVRFTDPFFEQTITRCLRRPFNQLFRHQTPVEQLLARQAVSRSLAPSGFIFHTSRCGSTLVAQMLAALPQNLVISEAGPIDTILRADERLRGLPEETRIEWLRALLSALCERRGDELQHCFVKLDSWHTLDIKLLRRAFPGVPFVFLYREPVEVIVSHLRRRGAQMIPGVLDPARLSLEASSVGSMPPEEYCARVLGAMCRAALTDCEDASMLLVNYRELPGAVCTRLTAWLGAHYTDAERERMACAAQFDAKNPVLPFADDTEAKRREAGEAVRRAADAWVRPFYEALEAKNVEARRVCAEQRR